MSSSLTAVLATAKDQVRAALFSYLPVGYPTVPASIQAMLATVAGGADVVEIGVPYSDPGMDGPTIQEAVDVAVRAGVSMRDVLGAVEASAALPAIWRPRAVPGRSRPI